MGKIYKPRLRELAAKEKIRQEIEKRSGQDTIVDLKLDVQKSGNIVATAVLALKHDDRDRSELGNSIQEAFVDLPIELTLKWQ